MRRLISFGLAGGLSTAVHVAVASTLITAGVGQMDRLTGWRLAWPLYVSNALQSQLTFRTDMSRRRLGRFVAVTVAGAGMSIAISGGAAWLGMHYLVGIAVVVVTLPPLTFLAHSRWTYR